MTHPDDRGADVAHQVQPGTWQVQDRQVDLPVVIPDAACGGAAFACDPVAVSAHLPAGFTPVAVRRRALSVLALIRYAPFALGDYDEVAVAVLVRGPSGGAGGMVLDLPVTQALTREAGEDIWGLPKWVARTEGAVMDPGHARMALWDGDDRVMTADVAAAGPRVPIPLPAPLTTWSAPSAGAQAGSVLRGRQTLRLRDVRTGRGPVRIDLGTHRMAQRMADLGMAGRPLVTFTARMSCALGAWQRVA